MLDSSLAEWIVLGLISLSAAFVAVFVLSNRGRPKLLKTSLAEEAVWMFDDEDLLEVTSRAGLLCAKSDQPFDWGKLKQFFSVDFPTFPKSPSEVRANGQIVVLPSDKANPKEVFCEWIDGVTRVHLRHGGLVRDTHEPAKLESSSLELETMKTAMDDSHYPIWRVESSGQVTWSNTAYQTLYRIIHGTEPDPGTALFSMTGETPIPTKRARRSLVVQDTGKKLWFDLTIVQHDFGALCYAVDINAVVDAEVAQRNFVQTLAKTFAQLSIGLAIFDRNRQLVLFNPALIDLTALPADFLSARPTLLSFFDRLRDQRMVPEPKNYGSWRDQLAELVAAATDGRYQETWSLPSGSVYSVSGRPHPDGAVAFLFEDITAEITLTRRFRSDLELGQSILNGLDDAIAVFSVNGTLTFSNTSYQNLWNVDPEKSFAQTAIVDALRIWQENCAATPVWGDIRDFVTSSENRAEWWARVVLKSGKTLICGVHPISNGATMINFSYEVPNLAVTSESQEIAPAD